MGGVPACGLADRARRHAARRLIVIEVFLGIAELVIIHGATFASSGGGGA